MKKARRDAGSTAGPGDLCQAAGIVPPPQGFYGLETLNQGRESRIGVRALLFEI